MMIVAIGRFLVLIPVVFYFLCNATTIGQSTALPTPDPRLVFDQPDAPALAKEKYGRIWNLGFARWKECRNAFAGAAVGLSAVVESVVPIADNRVAVRFKLYSFSSGGSNGDSDFAIGPKEDRREPAQDPRVFGKTAELIWDNSFGPPPVARGRLIYLGLDRENKVICFRFPVADIADVRLDSNGLCEAIVLLFRPAAMRKLDDGFSYLDGWSREGKREYIYVRPRYTDLYVGAGSDVFWSEQTGVVLTALSEEAGDEVIENEKNRGERQGIPVQNDGEFRFAPGRDGWQLLDSIPRIAGPRAYTYLVPERQFICLPLWGVHNSPESYDETYNIKRSSSPLWIFPDSDRRLLSRSELGKLSPEDLWRARNEIFARRGYKFSSDRGKQFAKSLGEAYHGTESDMNVLSRGMNAIEKANVESIREFENR